MYLSLSAWDGTRNRYVAAGAAFQLMLKRRKLGKRLINRWTRDGGKLKLCRPDRVFIRHSKCDALDVFLTFLISDFYVTKQLKEGIPSHLFTIRQHWHPIWPDVSLRCGDTSTQLVNLLNQTQTWAPKRYKHFLLIIALSGNVSESNSGTDQRSTPLTRKSRFFWGVAHISPYQSGFRPWLFDDEDETSAWSSNKDVIVIHHHCLCVCVCVLRKAYVCAGWEWPFLSWWCASLGFGISLPR